MGTETPFIFPVSPEDFWRKMREVIHKELGDKNEKDVGYTVPGLVQKPLFKAHEVCAMLQVSRQTLHTWVKEGVIKAYKIKSRVFFLWTDIEKLIHKESD